MLGFKIEFVKDGVSPGKLQVQHGITFTTSMGNGRSLLGFKIEFVKDGVSPGVPISGNLLEIPWQIRGERSIIVRK